MSIRRKLYYLKYLSCLGIILLLTRLLYTYWDSACSINNTLRINPRINYHQKSESGFKLPKLITLVTVMCHGPQLNHYNSNNYSDGTSSRSSRKGISRQMSQMQVMLKSLLLMEHEYLRGNEEGDVKTIELILFTDYKEYYDQIVHFLYYSDEIHSRYLKPLKLVYAPVVYPKGYEHMKYFFRPCTTLRLFMDKILPSHNEIVYLDTDIIFLKPVHHLYKDFYTFNQTQWCGMGMDWYHHHGHPIPYYGSQGLNAGVGIYNLTRMRASNFSKSLDQMFEEYLNKTKFADQDILNVYFHFHPQELKLLPCDRNFIPNYCRLENLCPSALATGVTILHGITMSFMPDSFETQFLLTFEFFKSLKLTQVQRLERIELQLKEQLCESERRIRLSFTLSDENCARNLRFANALLGQPL